MPVKLNFYFAEERLPTAEVRSSRNARSDESSKNFGKSFVWKIYASTNLGFKYHSGNGRLNDIGSVQAVDTVDPENALLVANHPFLVNPEKENDNMWKKKK